MMKRSKIGRSGFPARTIPSFGTTVIVGILIGVTLYHVITLIVMNYSVRMATNTYRWYTTPHNCSGSPKKLRDMVELASKTSKVLASLGVPSVVCYGTLWGVLRRQDVLPWDNNVDFCVMKDSLENQTFSDLQQTFAKEDVAMSDFTYLGGSYRLVRGEAEGFINVFFDCTSLFYSTHPENENNVPDYLPYREPERPKWACSYNFLSVLSRLSHDLNRPFPAWLLQPPFNTRKLRDVPLHVPHDFIEMQKYIYPDDWWREAKPIGC